MPATRPQREAGRLALAVVIGAAVVRVLAAVAAGLIAVGQHNDLDTGRLHTGEVLNAFGAAGDTSNALLCAAAVALAWWLSHQGAASRTTVSLLRAVILATAAMVAARLTAVVVLDVNSDRFASDLAIIVGFAVADLALCAGSLLLLNRLRDVDQEIEPSELEPLLFAVDRGNGEVFAFFSFAQARRTISPYSIEENEYTFFTDEGDLVAANADDLHVTFMPTQENRREELMQALRAFARKQSLTVEEPQDPTSYAVPIADWQWLELWPHWMRPIGRLVRRLQR